MCVGNALNYSTTDHDQLFHWERMYTHTFMILVILNGDIRCDIRYVIFLFT